MSVSIINTFEIVECNKALAEAGLEATLHLRDACGAQSLWLENESPTAKELVEKFFQGKGKAVSW